MTCNVCGVREATLHLTEIVNNKMIEIHLCETCAQEKGTDFKTHFNFSEMLAGLTDSPAKKTATRRKDVGSCPSCGMTYSEFAKSGRLGCAQCYVAFQKMLLPMMKRIQRSIQHIGKQPSRVAGSSKSAQDIRMLQDRLRQSVQSEEFEEAAKLRDQIKKIQDKLNRVNKKK